MREISRNSGMTCQKLFRRKVEPIGEDDVRKDLKRKRGGKSVVVSMTHQWKEKCQ